MKDDFKLWRDEQQEQVEKLKNDIIYLLKNLRDKSTSALADIEQGKKVTFNYDNYAQLEKLTALYNEKQRTIRIIDRLIEGKAL